MGICPPAFKGVRPLLDGEHQGLCRAVEEGAVHRPVLLEIGSSASAFELTRTLTAPSVLKPTGRTTYDGLSTIVHEDFDGVSLKSLLDRPLPLGEFLRIAVAVAEALAEIHEEGVIHKDIRPESVLIQPETCTIKLVGFAIATRAPRETALGPPRFIEGSLPYMSPEQTGRMNRAMDQRSDLYALGMTFYRMLTGRLPFAASDPVEWVYCHVAREPCPPTAHVTNLPPAVSAIIMKLLAKVAEDRYQTARGVTIDLRRCLAQWTDAGSIELFPLGARDLSERIHLPERFYGREPELARLLSAFHRVVESGQPELVVVSGGPGVGKSSLVRELHRPLVKERGAFVSGKADQYSQGVPYSTIATGLRDLILETLTESESRIAILRAELDAALGSNARIVIDLIPEVELLIGTKPAIVALPPAEAKFRFLATCQKLVSVFARRDHPLTLFLDDLQWADAASLELLQYILTHPETKHLLALAAYRDNEVSPSHPVATMLEDVAREQVSVSDLRLAPLSPEHVTALVSEALHAPHDRVTPLALLIHGKTEGNPFFVIQFVTTLVRDGLLEFDSAALGWRWDVPRIAARDYADNVVALMVQKIESLPQETRAVLRLAACIGTLADEETLTVLAGRPARSVHEALEPAVREGLLLLQDGSYHFLHDRIQQAAYTLVHEDERAAFQLEIGRSLLASPKQQKSHYFDIAHHLLLGASAIASEAESIECARVFLEAGRRAKASMAYKSAVTFLSAGVALLGPSWAHPHGLTYPLHFELAECLWLGADFDAAERALPPLLEHARTTVEKLSVYGIRVCVHMIRSEHEAALRAGLQAFRLVGVHFQLHPSAAEVDELHDRILALLGDRSIESLLDLPDMTNEEMRAALDLVAILIDCSFYVDTNLHNLLAYFSVASSLRYGNTASSFVGYAVYAFVAGIQRRFRDADRFAQVALAALTRTGTKAQATKICATVGVIAWARPYRSIVEIYERGERAGAEIGDHIWSAYMASDHARVRFLDGQPLHEVAREVERSIDATRRVKYAEVGGVQRTFARVIQKLRGLTSPEEEALFDENTEPSWSSYSRSLSLLGQLHGLVVFGAFEEAKKLCTILEPHLAAVRGVPFSALFPFFHAMTIAATYGTASEAERARYLLTLEGHERTYREWAESSQDNYGAAHALIRAEIARVRERPLDAEKLYEEAIARARESGHPQTEGFANETEARFHQARGLASIARMYLLEAHGAYTRWGAHGKVRQLERRHPELRDRARPASTSISSRSEQLDLMSVVKAAQTISGELDLDRLTSRLIQVVLEQSGADLARLLLVRGGQLRVESEARATQRGIETKRLSGGPGLVPESIVNYVWRTREKVLLGDARDHDGLRRFVSDEYIARERPRSILCFPVIRGSLVVGLLYLENNLVSHAFTRERIAALDVIASQAAITLEIAFWIQQEHEARDALTASEARFRRVSDSNMVGIIFCDLNGQITEANDYFLEMLGYSRKDVAQGELLWTALTPPELAYKDASAIRELRTLGTSRPFEKEYIRKDGTRVPVLLGVTFLEGSKTNTVAYILDITERKRAEQERDRLLVQEQHARAIAEEALRVRDDFLSITAHELRTPLTPLKMQIEVLALLAERTIPQGTRGRTELLDMLDRSNAQVDRLAQLMADLLDFSRIGAGRLVLSKEPTDLAAVVRELVKRCQSQVERAGCTVDVSLVDPLVGRWDRTRLEQAVFNVLTNAIKYGAGSPITVDLRADGEEVTLSVHDGGIGIDEKDHERIFGRFERAVSVHNFGGFGLGLYIAREIVRAHGGTIEVDSRPGAGATFIVRIPFDFEPARATSSA